MRLIQTIIFTASLTVAPLIHAAEPLAVEWHDEASDTTRITQILNEVGALHIADPGRRTAAIARHFIGTPYVGGTLEGEREALRVNLDELDCTTLVDVVAALSYTLGENRSGWQDLVYNLRRMRYRNGEINGYPSRLHYNCEWAVDNIHRGNIEDATRNIPKCFYIVRTIDFMSTHRDRYKALADSADFEAIRRVENGFRSHRFPYIKTADTRAKEVRAALREGDIVAFVSNLKDLDVTHLGLLVREADGLLHVLHASSAEGRVVVSAQPLPEFLRRNRQWLGIRVYRLRE